MPQSRRNVRDVGQHRVGIGSTARAQKGFLDRVFRVLQRTQHAIAMKLERISMRFQHLLRVEVEFCRVQIGTCASYCRAAAITGLRASDDATDYCTLHGMQCRNPSTAANPLVNVVVVLWTDDGFIVPLPWGESP